MARDVIVRKLNFLRTLLDDLRPYEGASLEQVDEESGSAEPATLKEIIRRAANAPDRRT